MFVVDPVAELDFIGAFRIQHFRTEGPAIFGRLAVGVLDELLGELSPRHDIDIALEHEPAREFEKRAIVGLHDVTLLCAQRIAIADEAIIELAPELEAIDLHRDGLAREIIGKRR